jgi:transposase
MYVATVPNRSSPPAILLRESFRDGRQVKTRTLANLSHWDPARVEALRRALRGEFDHMTEADPVSGPVFGLLFVLKRVADELGMTQALGSAVWGKLALFLTLARVAAQGSRLSAVRWAVDQAVREVLGLGDFDEDDLYAAMDEVERRHRRIEKSLYEAYLRRRGEGAPVLVLYDVTSSYLEGTRNELGEFGYNRDGKKGKLQIVVGLLTDEKGEPLAVRVFKGNTADPDTVAAQIEILKQEFGIQEVVFVGDRGMVKSRGKEALKGANLRYITALTDPQIRKLLKTGVLQLNLFDEKVCEVQAGDLRYVLRKNPDEERKQQHRVEDKLAKLARLIEARNQFVSQSGRADPESGRRNLQNWVQRHKLQGFVQVRLQDRLLTIEVDEQGKSDALLLAGCYVIETDIAPAAMPAQAVHDRYKDLARVERDFRSMKTGFLEIRPIYVRKAERTQAHALICMLSLKIEREMERRLVTRFGTTDTDRHAVTLSDALAALNRLCLQIYPVEDGLSITRLPRPDQRQQKILEALNVTIPQNSRDVGRRP